MVDYEFVKDESGDDIRDGTEHTRAYRHSRRRTSLLSMG